MSYAYFTSKSHDARLHILEAFTCCLAYSTTVWIADFHKGAIRKIFGMKNLLVQVCFISFHLYLQGSYLCLIGRFGEVYSCFGC